MSATLAAKYPLLDQEARTALRAAEPDRFQYHAQGGAYLNLRGLALEALPEIDEARIANLCRVVRGLLFAAVDGAQSGHPGGSSSKAEQVVTLLAVGRAWLRCVESQGRGARPRGVVGGSLQSAVSRAAGADLPDAAAQGRCAGRRRSAHGGLSRGSRPLPQMGRTERSRGEPLCARRYVHRLVRPWHLRGPGLRRAASLQRACHARVRDRGRCGDRRGHDVRSAQPGGESRHGKPGGHAGLQRVRHRRSDLRSHAGALCEPLVCARLERD